MSPKNPKIRIDTLLVQRGLREGVEDAQRIILAGKVFVDGKCIDKIGTEISSSSPIEIHDETSFASRAGKKLDGALDKFPIIIKEKICADVGSSTGGFTDVLLQRGAKKVYAIDVAYGELTWKLRQDSRVVVMERTNASYLDSLPEKTNFASIDVSLISIKKILPKVLQWIEKEGDIVALVKPQYEAGPEQLPKGAVIIDPQVHKEILLDHFQWSASLALFPCGLVKSSLPGRGGNREFLIWYQLISGNEKAIPELLAGIL